MGERAMSPTPKSDQGLLDLCPDESKREFAGQVDRAMGLLQPILVGVGASAEIAKNLRATLLIAVETACALKAVLEARSRTLSLWQAELLLQQLLLLFADATTWNAFTDVALERIENSNEGARLLPDPGNDPFDDFVRTITAIDRADQGDTVVAVLIATWRDGSRCAGRLFSLLAQGVAAGNDLISV